MNNTSKFFSALLIAAMPVSGLWAYNGNGTTPPADTAKLKFTVEEAPEWTALFKRSSGWFGGDGIFAMPLNGRDNVKASPANQTMFIFSDSIIGEVKDGKIQQPGLVMVHNSVAYLKGSEAKQDNLRFEFAKKPDGKPEHMFTPNIGDVQPDDYYWLGDGFVNTELNNTMYIFAWHMRNSDKNDDWSFGDLSTNLVAIPAGSKPPFTNHRQIATPLRFGKGDVFGAGIFVNTKASGAPKPDGYVYVYGVRPSKQLMVARVLPKDFEKFSEWRFWDGSGWNADMSKVVTIADRVSNELSVTALPDGRFALVYQQDSMSSKIALRVGATPYSGFGAAQEVYDCAEGKKKNIITYNAKVHPSLSTPTELLISYNVNAFDFKNEIQADPNLYRPRFIRLKIQQ